MAWVRRQYLVPVNGERHYNHFLKLNGIKIHDLSSFPSCHVWAIFKLALTARDFVKDNYTSVMGFLSNIDFRDKIVASLTTHRFITPCR